jgi:predicted metal-dependent hydrolase
VREARRDLLIAVQPDLRVSVRAPDSHPMQHVLARIHAKRAWIARQLAEFEQFTPLPPPRFVSGETIMYLGRGYRLRVVAGANSVKVRDGRLAVSIDGRVSKRAVAVSVQNWHRACADRVFRKRAGRMREQVPLFAPLRIDLRVRQMTRRWGSCSPSGIISVNPVLVQAPRACIDYVLAHELVHLIEPAHSARFYHLLARVMPDWQDRRETLARAAVRWAV